MNDRIPGTVRAGRVFCFFPVALCAVMVLTGCADAPKKRASEGSLPRQFATRLTPDGVLREKGYHPTLDYSIGRTANGHYEGVLFRATDERPQRFSADNLTLSALDGMPYADLMLPIGEGQPVCIRVLAYDGQMRRELPLFRPSADNASPEDDGGDDTWDGEDDGTSDNGDTGTETPAPGEQIASTVLVVCRVLEYPIRSTLPQLAPVRREPAENEPAESESPSARADDARPAQDASVADMVMVRDEPREQASGSTGEGHAREARAAGKDTAAGAAVSDEVTHEATVMALANETDALAARFAVVMPGVEVLVYAPRAEAETAEHVANDLAHRLVRIVAREREIREEMALKNLHSGGRKDDDESFLQRIGSDMGLYLKKKF